MHPFDAFMCILDYQINKEAHVSRRMLVTMKCALWRFDRFMATHARQVPPPVKTAQELNTARGPDRTTRQQPAAPAPFGRPSAETVGSHHDDPLAASSSPMGGQCQRWPAPRLHGTRDTPSGAVIAWRTTRLAPPGASG